MANKHIDSLKARVAELENPWISVDTRPKHKQKFRNELTRRGVTVG